MFRASSFAGAARAARAVGSSLPWPATLLPWRQPIAVFAKARDRRQRRGKSRRQHKRTEYRGADHCLSLQSQRASLSQSRTLIGMETDFEQGGSLVAVDVRFARNGHCAVTVGEGRFSLTEIADTPSDKRRQQSWRRIHPRAYNRSSSARRGARGFDCCLGSSACCAVWPND